MCYGEHGALESPYDEKFKKVGRRGDDPFVPPGYHKIKIPLKQLYPTFKEYMDAEYEYDEETGEYGQRWENPNARWDGWWFKRVTDTLDPADPFLADPVNLEPCTDCKGAGWEAPLPDYGAIKCVSCDGSGRQLKSHLNTVIVDAVSDLLKKDKSMRLCSALITPFGEWIETDEHWFYTSLCTPKETSRWRKKIMNTLKKYQHHLAVSVLGHF